MRIKVIDNNNKALAGVNVTFEVQNKLIELTSDKNGIVVLEDAEDNETIKYYSNKDEVHELKFSKNKTISLKINTPLRNMLFVISDSDGKLAGDTTFVFRYLDQEIKKVSNHLGEIKLSNIPLNAEVKCFQINKNKEIVNKHVYKCQTTKNQYDITLDMKKTKGNIELILVDDNNKKVSKASLKIKINNDVFSKDISGSFVVKDVEIGSTIECKQIIVGQDLPWQKFTCKSDTKEFLVKCKHEIKRPEPTYNSKSKMKFMLVGSNSNPVPNAVVRFEIGENVRNKYTNQNGEVVSDDLEIGQKVNVSIDLKGRKLNQDFIFQGDEEMHKLVLKSNTGKNYTIAGLILLIIIAIAVYSTMDMTNKEKAETVTNKVPEKDINIISNYHFTLKDKQTKKPIYNSMIKMYYTDTVLISYTNKKGNAKIKALAKKTPIKFEVSKLGFYTISKNNITDSSLSDYMRKDTSIFISEKTIDCDGIAKSEGTKVSYQTCKMQIKKGRFKIWFNFFSQLHSIKVYSGDIDSISSENLIFESKEQIKGIYNCPYINFDNKDGIVTICVTSNDVKSRWVYKVYCAKTQYVKPINSTID